MKKKIAVVLAVALLSFPVSTGVAMASTTTVSTPTTTMEKSTATTNVGDEGIPVVNAYGKVIKAGILTGSSFAWLDVLLERFQIALEFNSTKKAEKILDQASERLAEAAELAKKGDKENVESALNLYAKKIEKAQELLDEEIKDDEANYSLSLSQEELDNLATKVNINNIFVLKDLLEKLPPQAAEKVFSNIERSLEKALERSERIESKINESDKEKTKDSQVDQDKESKKALNGLRNAYSLDKEDEKKVKETQNAPTSEITESEEFVGVSKQTKPEKSTNKQESNGDKSASKQEDNREKDNGKKDLRN